MRIEGLIGQPLGQFAVSGQFALEQPTEIKASNGGTSRTFEVELDLSYGLRARPARGDG